MSRNDPLHPDALPTNAGRPALLEMLEPDPASGSTVFDFGVVTGFQSASRTGARFES